MNILTLLTALIWLGGTWIRLYRQARFYQIEEYMSWRYLRWYFSERERWLPGRTILAWAVGTAIGFLLAEAPGTSVPGIIGMGAAVIAVWPPDEGEIKRAFRKTPRATRLLGGAFALAGFALMLYLLLASLPDFRRGAFIQGGLAGVLTFVSTPVLLVGGNLLMTPIEALLRRRFIHLARKVMREQHPVVVGITGSYGKTTTKNFVAEILNARYNTYATPKSYNTMMGVCLAINNDLVHDYSVDYFIVEMGAYIQGEIERICALTPPDIGVVVEVGPQHLERFGSLERIASAKYEIIRALPPSGVGVFNWDNAQVRAMYARGYPATRLAVSKMIAPDAIPEDGPRFVASDIHESLDGLRFTVTDTSTGESQRFDTQILGEHNVTNILLATAVGVHEGIPLRDIAFQVRKLKPADSRLTRQTTPEGITIINDAYSANPAGVVSALKVLGMHTTGKRLLITPGMVELGELMEQENRRLGEFAGQYATDIILVGEKRTQPIRAGLQAAGFPDERLMVTETLTEAVHWYKQNLEHGDTVLFLNDLPDIY